MGNGSAFLELFDAKINKEQFSNYLDKIVDKYKKLICVAMPKTVTERKKPLPYTPKGFSQRRSKHRYVYENSQPRFSVNVFSEQVFPEINKLKKEDV